MCCKLWDWVRLFKDQRSLQNPLLLEGQPVKCPSAKFLVVDIKARSSGTFPRYNFDPYRQIRYSLISWIFFGNYPPSVHVQTFRSIVYICKSETKLRTVFFLGLDFLCVWKIRASGHPQEHNGNNGMAGDVEEPASDYLNDDACQPGMLTIQTH